MTGNQVKPRSYVYILFGAILLGIAMCYSTAFAQNGAGSIQGTVTDSTGAVLPGASIHVVNQATGVASDTKSNSVGFYQVPDLFAGTYTLRITSQGMKTYSTSIQLLAAQNAVVNASLTAGAVTQQVVVSGTSVQLTTTNDGSISAVLDNPRINQLPMNGRSVLTLAQDVTPGLANGGQSVDGNNPESLEYLVDGVTTTQLLNGGETNDSALMIDPDSVEEVSMQVSNAGAQYATPFTGVITTKSGTNSLHGTVFETARNNGWGIAKSRQDPSNLVAPMYIRNEFGASAGGPIILPHIYNGKDKSFWFLAFERYSLATDKAVEGTVPTLAMRQGDFSGLVNGAGILQTLYDPSTTTNSSSCAATGGGPNPYCRTPFQNNQIPIGEESPTAKVYYDLTPAPTSTANPLVAQNFNATDHDLNLVAQVNFRLDHSFNENNRAFLRYSQIMNGTNTGNGYGEGGVRSVAADGIPAGEADGYNNASEASFLSSLGYTHIFSPTFFAQTTISQQWWNYTLVTGPSMNVHYESKLNLPNNFGRPGFPKLGNGTLNILNGDQNPLETSQIISMINQDFTKTYGSHQLQFGGTFRHIREMDLPELNQDGIPFNNQPTSVYNPSSGQTYAAYPNAGYADASLFLGSASAYNLYMPYPYSHYHLLEYDGYLQDNYHTKRNLTVNLGVRYEARPAEWYKYGLANSFDFKNHAVVLAVPPATLIAEGYTTQAIITNDENIGIKFETPTEAGMPASLLKNYDLIFLPRVGFAYQPLGGRWGTVIRAAYGKYDYDRPFADGSNQEMKNNPLSAAYSQNYTSASQAIDALPNELLRYNDPVQFGEMGVNTANVVDTNSTNAILPGVVSTTLPTDWAQPFITNMNFTIEQELKGNSAVRVSYIWSHANNLDIVDDYNNHPSNYQWEMATGTVPPSGTVIGSNQYAATATGPYDQTTWGGSNQRLSTGWSNYNVVEANYQRLFKRGVAYQVVFDYGREMHVGGDQTSTVYPDANYPGVMGTVGTMTSPYGTLYPGVAPPAPPANLPDWADYHAMEYYQGYKGGRVMNAKFNGIVDLPIGRGERILGNANRFVNEMVGGWQLAGAGTVESQLFSPSQGSWGQVSPLQVYKHKVPVTDCRSGTCYKAFMWYNGYLAPTVTTGVAGSTCTAKCVSGIPADYVPVQVPIDNTPGTTYYGTNDVVVTLSNGKQVTQPFDAGPQGAGYLARSMVNGPNNWSFDASLFKVFPVTERVSLRFNLDAFNAANVQGYTNPGANGLEEVQPGVGQASSYNTPRQIQFTLRLTF